jgi:dolichol-phosphate mannosyltransferase
MRSEATAEPCRQAGTTDQEQPMTPISVVIPVLDECDNIGPLVEEVADALRGRTAFEVVCVDDGSMDGTLEVLASLRASVPELRVFAHAQRCGQSAAIRTGVRRAMGPWVATLDGDGQNDPADLKRLLTARQNADARTKLFTGWRVDRKDPVGKRWASRAANTIRRALLGDATPDTGCGIKLFDRAVFLDLPYFDHMHRYLPALVQRAGWKTASVPVGHRPRSAGRSKYGNVARALVGITDLLGMAWLIRRNHVPVVVEIYPGKAETPA